MIQIITPAELKARLSLEEPLSIVDVREDDEVAEGMIPGAVHIRLGDLPDRFSEIKQTEDIVLVCRSGKRSQKAYEFLENQGYKNLYNMDGGMLQW